MLNGRQLTRRLVMKCLAAGTAAETFARSPLCSALTQNEGAHSNVHFGVQLNAFPIDPKNFQSFLDALREVKRIGYEGFEAGFRFVNSQFNNPGPARKQIEEFGLRFVGIHIFLSTPMYDAATGIAPAALYEEVATRRCCPGGPVLDLERGACFRRGHAQAQDRRP